MSGSGREAAARRSRRPRDRPRQTGRGAVAGDDEEDVGTRTRTGARDGRGATGGLRRTWGKDRLSSIDVTITTTVTATTAAVARWSRLDGIRWIQQLQPIRSSQFCETGGIYI